MDPRKSNEIKQTKSKYMTINFTSDYQFTTRLELEGEILEEVKETRLWCLILSSNLKWHSNTESIEKNAYKRMFILHNLVKFTLPTEELIHIYILYIRSVLENCAVVWHSSITLGEELELFRVQKTSYIMRKPWLKQIWKPWRKGENRTSLQKFCQKMH